MNQLTNGRGLLTYVALTWIRLTQKALIDLYSEPCYHWVRFRLQHRISYYLCYAVYVIHSGEILRLFKVDSQISLFCNFSPFWSILVPVSEFLKLFHVVIFSLKCWCIGIRFQKWIKFYVLAKCLVLPPWTWVWWLGFDFYLTYETYRVRFSTTFWYVLDLLRLNKKFWWHQISVIRISYYAASPVTKFTLSFQWRRHSENFYLSAAC